MGCIIYSPHWHWITPYVDVGVPYMHMNLGTCPYDPTQATGIIQLLNKEEDMMKEAYAQNIECEEPCEGILSRTVQ